MYDCTVLFIHSLNNFSIGIREPSVFSIDETRIFNALLLRQMTECEFNVTFKSQY